MKIRLTSLLLIVSFLASAQQRTIDIAEAERAFARYAIQHGTREAFLKFMDTGAIVFEDGEIKKAKPTWETKDAGKNKLIWAPAFAVISTSGDLGFTTGPWELKASTDAKDTALASGAFMTVWTKSNNEWKFLVDIGVSHNLKNPPVADMASVELNHVERAGYDASRYMLAAEQTFISAYASFGKEAYKTVADNDIHILNPNQLPVHGIYSIDAALVNMSGSIQFQAVGSGVSKDGDIGYVYGNATENGKKGNYLRVWRRIGRKWTLIMQALTI